MDKGMHQVVQSLVELGKENCVDYHTNSPVEEILLECNRACGIRIGDKEHLFDRVITNMDAAYLQQAPSSVKPPQKSAQSRKVYFRFDLLLGHP